VLASGRGAPRPQKEVTVSRLALLITSLVVGAVLAVGATYATTALVSSSVTPSNQTSYNYGG
jgi:hypothetical protein